MPSSRAAQSRTRTCPATKSVRPDSCRKRAARPRSISVSRCSPASGCRSTASVDATTTSGAPCSWASGVRPPRLPRPRGGRRPGRPPGRPPPPVQRPAGYPPEPRAEQSEGPLHRRLDPLPHRLGGLPGDHRPPDLDEHRPVGPGDGTCDDPGERVLRAGPRLLGEGGRQCRLGALAEFQQSGPQRRAVRDDPPERADPGVQPDRRVPVGDACQQVGPDGVHGGAAGRPPPDHLGKVGDHLVLPVEEQVLLGREVVEDRVGRDPGGPGHLDHRDLLEAALGEQAHGGVGQELPGLLLLEFAKSHGGILSPDCGVT